MHVNSTVLMGHVRSVVLTLACRLCKSNSSLLLVKYGVEPEHHVASKDCATLSLLYTEGEIITVRKTVGCSLFIICAFHLTQVKLYRVGRNNRQVLSVRYDITYIIICLCRNAQYLQLVEVYTMNQILLCNVHTVMLLLNTCHKTRLEIQGSNPSILSA